MTTIDTASAMCDEIDRLRDLLRRASEALAPFADECASRSAWVDASADHPIGGSLLVNSDLIAARTVFSEIEKAIGHE